MKRLPLTLLALMLGVPLAHAGTTSPSLALPPPPVFHPSVVPLSNPPTVNLWVNVRLDDDTTVGTALPASDAPARPTVFESDLQMTDRFGASSHDRQDVTYVSNVQTSPKDPEHPVLALDKVSTGVGVTLNALQVYPDKRVAVIRVDLERHRLIALSNDNIGGGTTVQKPTMDGDALTQTVAIKVGETQDLVTPHGVLHLTLKRLARLNP